MANKRVNTEVTAPDRNKQLEIESLKRENFKLNEKLADRDVKILSLKNRIKALEKRSGLTDAETREKVAQALRGALEREKKMLGRAAEPS